MYIDKGKLIQNLIIYVIIGIVLTAIFGSSGDISLGAQIFAGFAGAIMLFLPVRLFPHIGLLGSIIVALVEAFLFVGVTSFLGETLGSIVGLILLLAAFIASLLFL